VPVGQIAPLREAARLACQWDVGHRRAAAAPSVDARMRCVRPCGWHRPWAHGPQQPAPHTCGPGRMWHRPHRDGRRYAPDLVRSFVYRSLPATGRERQGARQAQQGRTTRGTHGADLRCPDLSGLNRARRVHETWIAHSPRQSRSRSRPAYRDPNRTREGVDHASIAPAERNAAAQQRH
jgi:hypothetical protein